MMEFLLMAYTMLLMGFSLKAQQLTKVVGMVMDRQSKRFIENGRVMLEGTSISQTLSDGGSFQFSTSIQEASILLISAPDFNDMRIPLQLEGGTLDLGVLLLEKDITMEKSDNLISLTDTELFDDDIVASSTGILQASRDLFLKRAAFDFGQAFFRVRGYDAQYGRVTINGIAMNRPIDGRPQWNHWGGLNDVTRTQQYTHGMEASDFSFGGILGTANIEIRPSALRPGIRLSAAASNRTYSGRMMATYNTGIKKNGFGTLFSASRRWAEEGYIKGTLYDAFSFLGAIEFHPDKRNSIQAMGMFAANRRGRSSAITEEVFELVGHRYNPYWGYQNGEIRNSRERKIAEPLFVLNHIYNSGRFNLNTGMAYQFGSEARSRLGYFNAPNPDPSYYRYLPSFYLNSPIGANFLSALAAKEGFINNPQMQWSDFYLANKNGTAYVFYDDVNDGRKFSLNTTANYLDENGFQIDFGFSHSRSKYDNYARIIDLLGAEVHEDVDPFSKTGNDLNSDGKVYEGSIFNYRYKIDAKQYEAFLQMRWNYKKWTGFVAGNYTLQQYQREGIFQNERFLENSLGKSEVLSFQNFGIKGGLSNQIAGRHRIVAHVAQLSQAPVLQNSFINPRENNQVVPELKSEKIASVDLNYFLSLPDITGRATGFFTRFQNLTDINFFFVDSGVGSDFVQEVLTDLDKLHLGIELGFEYQISPTVKLSLVGAIGNYLYASDPNVTINFDTAGAEETLIDPGGNIDLGLAKLKDYKLAQGPQKAFSIGWEYRDPKYWWVGGTANYLANNHAGISAIVRTQSFLLDPETGAPFPDATATNVRNLLSQRALDDFYLLNLVGGKSWLKKGKYISLFLSINNLFDTVFKTGGYEQSRNGNFGQLARDNLSGSPSFAPKYWYGFGRTYFLNLALSF